MIVELLNVYNNNCIADSHVPSRTAPGGSLRQSAAVIRTLALDASYTGNNDSPFRFVWSHKRKRRT